jgi:signal transduction histidine kinase
MAGGAATVFVACGVTLVISGGLPDVHERGGVAFALVLTQLVILSCVAQHFPVPLGQQRKFDLSQPVRLALLLLAPTALAVVLAGVTEAAGQLTLALRKEPRTGRPRRGISSVIFNTSQIVIGTALAGFLRDGVVRIASADTRFTVPALDVEVGTLLGVVVAAVALYLANSVAVAVMVGRSTGTSPLVVWRQGRRWSTLQSVGLLTLGAVAAHAAAESPWVPLAMAVPAALTYAALNRTAEAEAAVRLRDEFLGVAAHELRTPLTSLRGYAQLLAGQAERGAPIDDAKLSRSLRTIDRQSGKLCELIDQLLDVSRLQAHQLALQRRTFDLVGLAREVATALQPLIPSYALAVVAPRAVAVYADRLRLEQVLTNLLTNAARYAGKGERIDVEIDPTAAGGGLTLAVRDYGVGIPVEHRERIFERFYQVGPDAKAGGLGIGLFVTRQIVHLHGGQITAECPRSGGTRFVVTLPAEVLVPNVAPAPTLTPATVLVNSGMS